MDQVQHPRAVADADPRRPGNPGVAVDEAGPAAPGLQRQPAPEAEAAVDPERLPAVDRHEADALAAQPLHRFGGFRDQPLAQGRVGAVAGEPEHVVVEAFGPIVAEVGDRNLLFRQIRAQGADIVHAVIGKAEGAGGKARVAAIFGLGSALQHQHRSAGLARRQRRTEGRIPGADDDDIGMAHDPSGNVMIRHGAPGGPGIPA